MARMNWPRVEIERRASRQNNGEPYPEWGPPIRTRPPSDPRRTAKQGAARNQGRRGVKKVAQAQVFHINSCSEALLYGQPIGSIMRKSKPGESPARAKRYENFKCVDQRVPQEDWRVVEACGQWFYVGPYQGAWWVMKYSDPAKILPIDNDLFSADSELDAYHRLNQYLIADGICMSRRQKIEARRTESQLKVREKEMRASKGAPSKDKNPAAPDRTPREGRENELATLKRAALNKVASKMGFDQDEIASAEPEEIIASILDEEFANAWYAAEDLEGLGIRALKKIATQEAGYESADLKGKTVEEVVGMIVSTEWELEGDFSLNGPNGDDHFDQGHSFAGEPDGTTSSVCDWGCNVCGAVVADRDVHRAWHESLEL